MSYLNWSCKLVAAVVLALSSVSATDAAIDTIQFGDLASETQHQLQADHAATIRGGLDQTARQLLPLDPVSFEGGAISFNLKTDPDRQNYVTVKLWGSDRGAESGRLVLFINGLQLGYRHEGDYDVLNQCDEEAEFPGRFLYQTLPLPVWLTRGKTSVALKILAIGAQWPYGANFTQYQKNLTQPTRGIYRIYTHTEPRFVPDESEKQGSLADAPVRPSPGEEVIEESRNVVIERLNRLLGMPAPAGKPMDQKARAAELLLLGEAYNVAWTSAYHDRRAIDRIIADGDSMAHDFKTTRNFVARDWPGAGPLGEAVVRTWPAIDRQLDNSRRIAWTDTLRQSVDYWRTHRRDYTNQSMIVDRNIYTANRALKLLAPQRALPDEKVMHYLYQATGLEPWLGSDVPDHADQAGVADAPSAGLNKPFGEHYHLVTQKGLTRELGYVGTYGETILHFTHDIADLTGDERIRKQLAKLEAARMYFRYPGVDGDGYRCMKLASEIDNRTAHYPVAGSAYNAPNIREEWWMDIPAMLSDDTIAVGAAQQALADNQYFNYVKSRLNDPDTQGMMRNVDEYQKVKSLPPSAYRMPMTDGQPDFVFADEEDAVLALKQGGDRLFINFYYRSEHGVNGVARVLELTPAIDRIATVKTDCEVDASGQVYKRQDWIDATRSKGFPPPGQELHQAWAGEEMQIAQRPPDAILPKYGGWGPFVGKAAFYQLRYGHYLIGLNTSQSKSYVLKAESVSGQATDVRTGKPVDLSQPITVGPLSTTVLVIGD